MCIRDRYEFELVLKKLRNNKAPCVDNTHAKLLKAEGTKMNDRLNSLLCIIYEYGKLPSVFSKKH